MIEYGMSVTGWPRSPEMSGTSQTSSPAPQMRATRKNPISVSGFALSTAYSVAHWSRRDARCLTAASTAAAMSEA